MSSQFTASKRIDRPLSPYAHHHHPKTYTTYFGFPNNIPQSNHTPTDEPWAYTNSTIKHNSFNIEKDFSSYIHIKKHPNGGATVVHLDHNELGHLSPDEMNCLSDQFFEEVFREDSEGCPCHVMGVVHNSASYLPELVTHFAEHHSDVIVKMGNLRNAEIETTTFAEYCQRVQESYGNGTFRCGPLLQVSLVGQVSEETGRYFPDFLSK